MKDELLFCPLGGSGEIGMNMNLFGYGKPSDHKWIMVDIGVTFADDTIPGVDLIYPDPGFIVERKDNFLVAVIASIGVILGAAYMLWLYKRVVFGKLINEDLKKILDLNRSEYFILSCLAAPILFFGFYPDPLINTIEVSVTDLINMHNSNIASK